MEHTDLRPYYSPSSFNSPLTLREPVFSSYSGASIAANSSIPLKASNVPQSHGSSVIVGDSDFELDFGSTGDTVAEIGRSMLRLYGKIFFSQPWRVGRLLLQVGDWSYLEQQLKKESKRKARKQITNISDEDDEYDDDFSRRRKSDGRSRLQYEEHLRSSSSLSFRGLGRKEIEELKMNADEEDDGDDLESYFTNISDELPTRTNVRRSKTSLDQYDRPNRSLIHTDDSTRPKRRTSSLGAHEMSDSYPEDFEEYSEYTNRIAPESLVFGDVIGALQSRDGFRGLWRGVNTTFIMDAMQLTLEAWLSGFFSSLSGVPDPHFLDITHSATPGASLATAVAASVVTAVVLSPLSIIRTRMVTTTFETNPRSVRTSLKELDSLVCPSEVFLPTVLFSSATSVLSKSTSYILQHILGVDPSSSPLWYSMLSFISNVLQVGVKLPLETLVRRAHLSYLKLSSESLLIKPMKYEGVFGTMWSILSGRVGIETLYRGWRVSMLGVISEWGVEALDRADRGKELF